MSETVYYEDFGLLEHLAKSLQHAYVYDGNYSAHRDRAHGRPIDDLPGDRFVVFAQNHDQIGNRARGERLSRLVSLGRQKIAAALVLTSPFVPMLFQGRGVWRVVALSLLLTTRPRIRQEEVSEGRKNEFGAFGWNPDRSPGSAERLDLRTIEAALERSKRRTARVPAATGTRS